MPQLVARFVEHIAQGQLHQLEQREQSLPFDCRQSIEDVIVARVMRSGHRASSVGPLPTCLCGIAHKTSVPPLLGALTHRPAKAVGVTFAPIPPSEERPMPPPDYSF